MMIFDLKHHIRYYRNLYLIISGLLMIPVIIVTLFNSMEEGMKLAFFFLVIAELPGFVLMINRISAVKKAFRSVVLSGVEVGRRMAYVQSQNGERYLVGGFYNFIPLFRKRCRFVVYKRQAWIVELDCTIK